MRIAVAVIMLLSLCAPAGAAETHHVRPRHHVIAHPGEGAAVPSGWYKFPGYPPIPPEQNRNLDPSNFGGG
jgi:hypothetical protein